MRMFFTILILSSALLSRVVCAETPDLELIMSDPDWIGNAPVQPWWSDDAAHVYFRQKRIGENYRDIYRVPTAGGTARAA